MADNTEVQKSTSMQDIIDDHMNGVSGYEIADKYGMDTEKVKQLIDQAEKEGKFIPDSGATDPLVRDVQQPKVASPSQPLVEGVNPKAEVETTKK